jgi:putative FmdB family regulatory protein
MPTYEYECTKCGERFELFQSITEPAKKRVAKELKACKCDAAVTRCIGTGAGIIFKGSGFYETDYRSEGYKKAAKAEQEAASGKSSDRSADATATKDKSSDTAASKDSTATPAKAAETPSASANGKSAASGPAPKASKSAAKRAAPSKSPRKKSR